MYLKILILSVIMVAFTVLALGVKLLFNKEPSLSEHACAAEDGELNKLGGCAACEIQKLAHCSEKENK